VIEEDWGGLSGRREEKSRSLAPLWSTFAPTKKGRGGTQQHMGGRLLTLSASSTTINPNLAYHGRSQESASLWKNNLAWNFCA
jgi:hypothetical protein